MSPAGMERAGALRHGPSPVGVRVRENANQSNLRTELPLSLPTLWHVGLCPRRESNPHLRFRKPSFSPLNYGDQSISDFRSRTADFKRRTLALALCRKSAANWRGEAMLCRARIALDAAQSNL